MDTLEFIAELAWPAVTLLLTLILTLVFKAEIAKVLARLIRAGPAEFAPPREQPSAPEPGAAQEELKGSPDAHPLVQHVIKVVAEKVPDGPDRERRITEAVAAYAILAAYEGIYGFIYQAQIEALRHIQALGKAKVKAIEEIYSAAAKKNPAVYRNYEFATWLAWLRDRGLVQYEDGVASLTESGRVFVEYLKNKPDRPW